MQLKKIRPARRTDLAQVVRIDARITGLAKPKYWAGVLERYGRRRRSSSRLSSSSHFLVCDVQGQVVGYIVGEVRDWEFGAPPCGWVFGIGVQPGDRLGGIGAALLEAICERFREAGVDTVRTLLSRDNSLVLAFFRSQGMMAGPFIPLEKRIA
ncbi:MAG TPA: GNAT family N-acetyltransferase [Burkholderiales bacterium]|nr:GNAT family N-acetyltransferase [Burkholderiales bacterium]